MSELFDDDDAEKVLVNDDVLDDPVLEHSDQPISDARMRLEQVLEEKRLRDELQDFFDY